MSKKLDYIIIIVTINIPTARSWNELEFGMSTYY